MGTSLSEDEVKEVEDCLDEAMQEVERSIEDHLDQEEMDDERRVGDRLNETEREDERRVGEHKTEDDSPDARIGFFSRSTLVKGSTQKNGSTNGHHQSTNGELHNVVFPSMSNGHNGSTFQPLHPSPYAYRMTHARRGRCVIFNNKIFDADSGLPLREGTDLDAERAESTFYRLGFDVIVHTDQSADQMTRAMLRLGAADHSDSDCVAVVILSHGSDGGVVYGRDKAVPIDAFVTPLKGGACQTLVGKPKLFFVQACRGEKCDDGTDLVSTDGGLDEADSAPSYRLPQEADVLLAFSTVSGYYSWRSGTTGSYFIQALCEMLDRYASDLDVAKILTRVGHEVATQFDSCVRANPDYHRKKQMPSVMTTLTKDLYLTPKRVVSTV